MKTPSRDINGNLWSSQVRIQTGKSKESSLHRSENRYASAEHLQTNDMVVINNGKGSNLRFDSATKSQERLERSPALLGILARHKHRTKQNSIEFFDKKADLMHRSLDNCSSVSGNRTIQGRFRPGSQHADHGNIVSNSICVSGVGMKKQPSLITDLRNAETATDDLVVTSS